MATVADPEGERLERLGRLNDLVEEWKSRLLEDLASTASPPQETVDSSYSDRFEETSRRLFRLHDGLHADDFDDRAVAEFRGLIIDGLKTLERDDEAPLDKLNDVLIRAEAMRHLLRDAIDGHVEGSQDSTRAIVGQLQEWLPRVSQAELAELVGVSTRQYQRWAKLDADPSRRARLVVRLVALLKRSWSPEGVIAWFERPRPELDNARPLDVLDDAGRERELLTAVRQGRAQHGS